MLNRWFYLILKVTLKEFERIFGSKFVITEPSHILHAQSDERAARAIIARR